jgi:NTE family protein
MAGWLPAGLMSTEPLEEVVGRAVPGRWVEHPNFWAVACDYGSGRRVPFGRKGAPLARVADAVAASCAIPGFYRPVKIGARRYVDGGVCSPSSVDLLAGRGLDLVICLNPLSGPPGTPADPRDWLGALSRGANGRRLAHEVRKVRRLGTEVVTLQPTPEDLRAMGRNLMSARRRQQVIETAERTVLGQLRSPEIRQHLGGLPRGEPHKIRRPAGPRPAGPR